jgi:hypothetical protein
MTAYKNMDLDQLRGHIARLEVMLDSEYRHRGRQSRYRRHLAAIHTVFADHYRWVVRQYEQPDQDDPADGPPAGPIDSIPRDAGAVRDMLIDSITGVHDGLATAIDEFEPDDGDGFRLRIGDGRTYRVVVTESCEIETPAREQHNGRLDPVKAKLAQARAKFYDK